MIFHSTTFAIFIYNRFIGTNFGMLDNQGQIQAILNGTTMQISDNISVLCATDKSNSNIEWRYNIVDSDSVASKTPNSVFSATTGFSILEISAEEPGMYTCVIDESISYSILTIDTASSISMSICKCILPQNVDHTIL